MAAFNYELSDSEINAIAKKIEDNITNRLLVSDSIKALDDRVKESAVHYANLLVNNAHLNAEVRDIVAPLVSKSVECHINLNPDILTKSLNDFFHSDNFKRRELYELKERVKELESELGYE